MGIEVLIDGKELVGFYRSDTPIGTAHMVNADQMAKLYEVLEAQRDAAIAAISEEGRKRGEVEAKLDLCWSEFDKTYDAEIKQHKAKLAALVKVAEEVADKDHHAWNCSAQKRDCSGDSWVEEENCDCGINKLKAAIAAAKERP